MIGLLTFHWADDYGGLLQAYALKSCLEELGGETEIIPYAPWRLVGRYWQFPLLYRLQDTKPRFRLTWSVRAWRKNLPQRRILRHRKQAMARFRRLLTTQKPLRSARSISLKPYSCVFVGSDQVWNPEITLGLDDAYLGNLPHGEGCRMASYGASFGRDCLPEAYWEQFAACVEKNFAGVSVREQCAVPFAAGILHREVISVLDPVLLLKKAQWEAVAAPPAERDYVLVYQTEENRRLAEYAQKTAQRLGKPVISVSYPFRGEEPARMEQRVEIGPAEFAGYIRNAACVVTNSFHGTAFSILFQKPFLVFSHGRLNARIEDLLEKLGLSRRTAEGTALPEAGRIWEEINWNQVDARLEGERGQSKAYIQRQINGGT